MIFANWLSHIDRPLYERTTVTVGYLELFELDAALPKKSKNYSPTQIKKACAKSRVAMTAVTSLFTLSPRFIDIGVATEQAAHGSLVLGLALQIHHREQGEFPESLDSLLDNLLNELPIDPFGKGEPIRLI